MAKVAAELANGGRHDLAASISALHSTFKPVFLAADYTTKELGDNEMVNSPPCCSQRRSPRVLLRKLPLVLCAPVRWKHLTPKAAVTPEARALLPTHL